MALSQLQCLDDNNVNPRINESKSGFLYSEDQRLALEALLLDGREAFLKYLEARGLRGFLSDMEMESLTEAAEPYDPSSDLFPEDAEDDEPPLSLHYWPELSDTSVPQIDIGWPDTQSYRGVTRTTVYSQPPVDGQTHIKEVVRKMIAQAQKVIAVVMDVFTDVDIFRDLLDAGFKRKVSVYILLEHASLPHFLDMCRRADMHPGHLKHLRVRCIGGQEFHTRSSTKVRGQMGHRFMFIDGDKAVSGSYSFTWMSSRLDRNLITVVTGQAVEAFDKLFRILHGTSTLVDLRQVATEPEPEPEPLPPPVAVAPPSAALARKLYNPKYALLLGSSCPSPKPLSDTNNTENPQSQENSEVPDSKKRRKERAALQEAPPIHPGLINLEKASLIMYLPTWPEPDPPSDVIGFINIRDNKKPIQVHLQRSEMFETSQAIRFSSPFNKPDESLPETAKPRQVTPRRHDKTNEAQDKRQAAQPAADDAQPGHIQSKVEAREQNSPASGSKCESEKSLNTENKSTKQNAGHNPTQPQPTTNNPKPDPLPGPNSGKDLNTQSAAAYKMHSVGSKRTPTSHQGSPTDSNIHAEPQQAVQVKPQSSDITQNALTPTVGLSVSPASPSAKRSQPNSSAPLSDNKHVSITSARSPLSSSSAAVSPPLPSSSTPSSLSPTPPIPKPRTIQLVMKDAATNNHQKLPELIVKPETNPTPPVTCNEPAGAPVVRKNPPETKWESVPELQNSSGAQKCAEEVRNRGGVTSQKTKNEEMAALRDDRAGTAVVEPADRLRTGSPKTMKKNQEITPKDVEIKTSRHSDIKLTSRTDASLSQTGIKACEVPNVTSCKTRELYRMSCKELTPNDVLDAEDTSAAQKQGQRGNPEITPARGRDGAVRDGTPGKPLRLHLPDSNVPELRSPTPERDSWLLMALARTPTPDRFLPRTPTPDSQTHTPEPRAYTPDFRTPTSDISDGYGSPRTDSLPSTTSEEYYECSDSPVYEPVFRNHRMTEDHVSFTHTPSNATVSTSHTYIHNYPCAFTLATTDRETPSSATESGPDSASSQSSSPERRVKKEKTTSEEIARAANDEGRSVTQRGEAATDKNKETRPQAPLRKRAPHQSVAERSDDIGVTPGDSANEVAEPKRLSTGDLKGERADKEKAVDGAASGATGVERRGRNQSARESEEQKLLHGFLRPPRGRQQDHAASSPSRPSTSPPSPSGAPPSGSKGTSQVLDNASSPRRPPSRPPPPAAEWKPGQDSTSWQRVPSPQPPAEPPNQHPHPKAPASAHHTHSNLKPQLQTVSAQEAHSQEEGKTPFGFTLSRLYSLKGLKERMSKSAQSKRGSSSPIQERKSTG